MAKKSTTRKKKDPSQGFKKYIKWFWMLFVGGITFIILLFLLASWNVFGTLPTFEQLENPENNLATKIMSVDGAQNRHLF